MIGNTFNMICHVLIILTLLSLFAAGQEKTAKYWEDKATEYYINGSDELALLCFDKSIELDSLNTYTWMRKGDILFRRGEYAEALKAYDKAIEIDPLNPYAWETKGKILFNQGKYSKAIQAYENSIEIDPLDVTFLNGKGNILLAQGKYEEAIMVYDNAIELASGSMLHISLHNKALALYHAGMYEESLQIYDNLLKEEPEDSTLWYSKSEVLKKLGRTKEAQAAYAKVKEDDNNSIENTYIEFMIGRYQGSSIQI